MHLILQWPGKVAALGSGTSVLRRFASAGFVVHNAGRNKKRLRWRQPRVLNFSGIIEIEMKSTKRITLLKSTALAAFAVGTGSAIAATLQVPNGSFESPTPPPGFPVSLMINSWQETPQPGWFNPADFGGMTWDQMSGVFPNPAAGDPSHIDNADGQQAAYLFAVPTVGLFQDYGSVAWNEAAPSHGFDVAYTVGVGYELTVGVLAGGGMGAGAGLRISLYYRDGADSLVTVAARDIVFSEAEFPTTTHLNDYQVSLPIVTSGDAWAGQKIGVSLIATTPGASYWDVDNVRLTAIPEPGTFALFGLGAGTLYLARRKFRLNGPA